LIKSVDKDLAEALHSSKRLAPWSATPLFLDLPSPKLVIRRIPAPSIVGVTFSIMDEKLSNAFREAILKPCLSIRVAEVKAKLVGVSVKTHDLSEILLKAKPLPKDSP
jgi:hypothetical protein